MQVWLNGVDASKDETGSKSLENFAGIAFEDFISGVDCEIPLLEMEDKLLMIRNRLSVALAFTCR